jgi:hypothetical protein
MRSLAARVDAIGRYFSKPLPRALRLYPGEQVVRPAFPLSALTFETKLAMLTEVRQMKGSDGQVGAPFVFHLAQLSLELRLRMLQELRAHREKQQQQCPSPPLQ